MILCVYNKTATALNILEIVDGVENKNGSSSGDRDIDDDFIFWRVNFRPFYIFLMRDSLNNNTLRLRRCENILVFIQSGLCRSRCNLAVPRQYTFLLNVNK